MSKIIFSKKDQIWVLVPKIVLIEELNKGEFEEIDIFCLFGQIKLINKFLTEGGMPNTTHPDTDFWKRELFIGLIDRIEILKFFNEKLIAQQQKILQEESKRDLNLIYDSRPYQKFQAYLLGHLNALHSIDAFCKEIDKYLKCNFWLKMEKDENFYTALAMRNSFQHHETPFIGVDESKIKILLVFHYMERIIGWNKFLGIKLPWLQQKEAHEFIFEAKENDSIYEILNQWAKKHLDTISKTETVNVIDEKRTSNGSIRFKKITLEDVLKIKK